MQVDVCAHLAFSLRSASYKWWKRTEDGGVTDSSSQGDSIYILFTGSRVWNIDEERFASLDGYEEVGFVCHHRKAMPTHCQLQNLPTPPPTSIHPLPFTHHPPGTTFWRHQPAVIPLLCCMAKSTCWEPFHQPPLEAFKGIQGHPLHRHTHKLTNTPKIRQSWRCRKQATIWN